jgi:hypothetical protein
MLDLLASAGADLSVRFEARLVFGEYLCARGLKSACGPTQ